MGYSIQLANTTLPLRFGLVLSSDHITGATGKTPTVTIAKSDGLGFVSPSGTVAEVGNGVYELRANATDASSLGPLSLHATASACDPIDEDFLVVYYNPSVTVSQAPTSPTTITVLDLITQVLQELTVLQAGEVPTSDDAADGLKIVNDFIDGVCAINRLLIYAITRTTWTITSAASYTVGPSGDVNIVRPSYIDHVNFIDSSFTTPLEMPTGILTDDDYANVGMKTFTSVYPQWSYYNPTFPTGTLNLFPIPTSTTLTGVLYAPTAVTRFGALTDLIALPPGYNRFLRKNLAVEFAPTWRDGLPVSPATVQAAHESMANLKRVNSRPRDMSIDTMWSGYGGHYNIWSDGYGL